MNQIPKLPVNQVGGESLSPPAGHNGGLALDAVLTSPTERDYWHGLIDEIEAAKFLGVSPRTIQGWRRRGGGPVFYRLSAKLVRYTRANLQTHAEQFLRTSTSDNGEGTGHAAA